MVKPLAALDREQLSVVAPIARDIRSELWVKLWGNLSFNPISALTHDTRRRRTPPAQRDSMA